MHRALLCVVITLFGLLSIACAVPLQDYTGTQLVSRKQVTASEGPLTVRFPRDPNNQHAVVLTKDSPPSKHKPPEDQLRAFHKWFFEELNKEIRLVVINSLNAKFPQAHIVFDPSFPFNDYEWTPVNGRPFHLHLHSEADHIDFVGTMKVLGTDCMGSFVRDDLSGNILFPTSKEIEDVKHTPITVIKAEKY
ncbi:hypothetical protein GGU11DRAFT_744292 [Lentinula aff. detonsa]|uniref:Uncharacterized protein n=1 Tax=Lentinula aff. detonsa TaxID=2804958 RepID=A0AA38L5T6_9AGAR|nr:hypothetical protein GGU10DRAFT_353354 [Lentinula aff. detonsa]KAJ3798444.1 hypothetical protein GGU11DRAFT_744292 [Lentinula aff. detonsa]